jgi:hypothetical protein
MRVKRLPVWDHQSNRNKDPRHPQISEAVRTRHISTERLRRPESTCCCYLRAAPPPPSSPLTSQSLHQPPPSLPKHIHRNPHTPHINPAPSITPRLTPRHPHIQRRKNHRRNQILHRTEIQFLHLHPRIITRYHRRGEKVKAFEAVEVRAARPG